MNKLLLCIGMCATAHVAMAMNQTIQMPPVETLKKNLEPKFGELDQLLKISVSLGGKKLTPKQVSTYIGKALDKYDEPCGPTPASSMLRMMREPEIVRAVFQGNPEGYAKMLKHDPALGIIQGNK